ncbi:hypothetical protein KXJ75_20880 [Aeromonas sanarellii]|nr:hypothetical protein KXJ75_20880 [Aeromonas sanarellii]
MAHYLHRNGEKNRRALTFISDTGGCITTLSQLSKISVDNYVKQLVQTLGQLASAGILLLSGLEKNTKTL